MKNRILFYISLFSQTFQLSLFTIGGGYVIVPLMKKRFVEKLGWMNEEEMLDYVALAQASPGAMAINASILVGYRLAGVMGIFVSVLGTVLPPFIILAVVSLCYTSFSSNQIVQNILRGMQAGVAAMMVDVVVNMCGNVIKDKKVISIILMAAAFSAVIFLNINAAWVIIVCGTVGVTVSSLRTVKKDEKNNDLS